MKKNNVKRITLLNIISNIILQIVNVISWLIIPKIILNYFGSNVNGLVSSIVQFLSYISLVEGGITGVVTASLYKPLINKENEKISSIIETSKKFYKKIGIIFSIYCLILAFFYPLLFNTGFDYLYVFSLVIVLSINMLIQYMYSLTYRNLLNADKKGYIVSFVQTIILILGIIFAYISVIIYPSIHILKFITGILFIIQPIVYNRYVNKNYCISNNVEEDKKLLKERWNGFAINIAAFIHNCTDIAILTIFCDYVTVSIYSVYVIVTNGLRSIFNAISNAIIPTIGQSYANGNNTEINQKMDIYEFVTFNIVFFMFTISGLLITPFVMIYTKGITDANYNQFIFGILLVISEALYIIKFPHLNLSYSANKFKELTKPAFIEAGINIIISMFLVKNFGLIGVAIGTICAMLYRMIYQVYFTKRLIENRHQLIFYKKLAIYSFFTIIGILICYYIIPLSDYNVNSWIKSAVIYCMIFGSIYFVVDEVFFKKELRYFKKYLLRR